VRASTFEHPAIAETRKKPSDGGTDADPEIGGEAQEGEGLRAYRRLGSFGDGCHDGGTERLDDGAGYEQCDGEATGRSIRLRKR
jgi:hypothetical protein